MKLQSNVIFLFVGTIQAMWIEAKTLPALPKSAQAPPTPIIAPTSSSAPSPQVTRCSKGKKLPHPENPNKYFQCQFISKADVWLTQPFTCPSLQHVFDEAKQSCVDNLGGKGRIDAEIEPPPATAAAAAGARIPAGALATASIILPNKGNDLKSTDDKITKDDRHNYIPGDPFAVIARLAGTIETLASTVQTLVASNENLTKQTALLNGKQEFVEEFISHLKVLDPSVLNERESFIIFPPGTSTPKIEPVAVAPTKTVFIQKPQEQEKEPVLPVPQIYNENDLNDASNESSEENISSPIEENKNPFENSLLKMWMMNFLPKPKIMHPIPNSLLAPSQNVMKRRHEILDVPWRTTTSTSSTTERSAEPESAFIEHKDEPTERRSTTVATTTISTSTPTTVVPSPSTRFPAFEYHYVHQPPVTSTVRPPPQPLVGNNAGGNLINLFSLFKRLTSRISDEESDEEEEDHDHRFPFSNPPSASASAPAVPQRLINSNSNLNTASVNPFIFQRIPMSSSSATTPLEPSKSNHMPLLQNIPPIPSAPRTQDKSPNDDNIRRPRQPRKQN